MGVKINFKRITFIIFSLFIMLLSVLIPTFQVSAGIEEAQQKFDKESAEFLKDATEARDIVRILDKDGKVNPNPSRDTISYVMRRLFYPGVYVNDVRDGVLAKELKVKKKDILYQEEQACFPNGTMNLIDHNCNIPNFTTGLVQNLADAYTPAFSNAGKTSAYSVFGLGVPSDIPGDTVPEDPSQRANTYTALELYGYSLKLTNYNGEWDNILVSNEARMLSNFGMIDKLTLVGTSIWNSVSTGISTFVDNFSFNPVRWFSNIGKSFEAGASSGINTVVDTSELNIVATNGWKRPRMDNSLYNVYVMTDAEVLRETSLNYFKVFSDALDGKINDSEKLKDVVALNPDSSLASVTQFTYKEDWETDKSKKKREKAKKERAEEEAHNEAERLKAQYSEEPYTPDIISPLTEIPEPKYYTESEQLGFWAEQDDVAPIIKKAQNNNLLEKDPGEFKSYEKMLKSWYDNYEPFFEQNFDALGETMSEILEELDSEIFQEYPHLDPKQSISRYACAASDGTMERESDGTAKYLYLKNNKGTTEYLNPDCAEARPVIGGGLLGNGFGGSVTDTRHISQVNENDTAFKQISGLVSSKVLDVNSFIAKVTNVVLDLSFQPLMEKLGITTIIAGLVEGFTETVFFPMVVLVIALGALLVFFQLLKEASVFKVLTSLGVTILIFIGGTIFLTNPANTVAVIDKLPATIDKIIAETILNDDDGTKYCSTGSSNDGIRSAQCNVWGAMVFEPWVKLQFGTSYDKLYANGYGEGFKNSNQSLVGDAEVNMGGGKIEHNWALYQLDVTKAGTINSKPSKSDIGVVDKDLYRLVDLQAGPNNAAKSDSTHFKTWTGEDRESLVALLTLIQSIVMGVALISIGFAKIEVSFVFAILVLLFPFFLLAGLLPKGRVKLWGYLANMLSLLIKKAIFVTMLAVLLKVITLGYSNSESLTYSALFSIFVSIAFIMYKKEITEIVSRNNIGAGLPGADINQIRNTIISSTPRGIRQLYSNTKAKVKGTTAGAVGGTIGAIQQQQRIKRERSNVQDEITKINRQLANGVKNPNLSEKLEDLKQKEKAIEMAMSNKKALSPARAAELEKERRDLELQIQENDIKIKEMILNNADKKEISSLIQENEELEKRQEEIDIEYAGGERDTNGVFANILKGSTHSRSVIGRTSERSLRKKGFSGLTSYRDVKEAVYTKGAADITSMKDPVARDVYRDVMSQSKNADASGQINKNEIGQLENPKLQKRIREMAEERRRIKSQVQDATTLDSAEMEKAANQIDKKRTLEKAQKVVTAPMIALQAHKADLKTRKESIRNSSDVQNIIVKIEEDIKDGKYGVIETDSQGRPVFRDNGGNMISKEEAEYREKLLELAERYEKVNDQLVQKANEEREEIVNPKPKEEK